MNVEVAETEFCNYKHSTQQRRFFPATKTWAENLSLYLSKEKSVTHRVVMVYARGCKKRVTGKATRTALLSFSIPFVVTVVHDLCE